MRIFGLICAGVLGLALIVGLSLGGRWLSLKIEGYFQPKEENVRREVFEETKSYNEGKEQQLIKYRYEHATGDELTKKAIESAVRTMFADYDEEKLEPELRSFLKKCRYFYIHKGIN